MRRLLITGANGTLGQHFKSRRQATDLRCPWNPSYTFSSSAWAVVSIGHYQPPYERR
jgi:hypothetical protein